MYTTDVNRKPPNRWIESSADPVTRAGQIQQASPITGTAPVRVDDSDPLALFDYDREVKASQSVTAEDQKVGADLLGPDGTIGLPAPMQGTIVTISVKAGDEIHEGQEIIILEAMKMEHAVKAGRSGIVRRLNVAEGDIIVQGHPLIYIEEADVGEGATQAEEEIDPDYIRPDLAETYRRHADALDENRLDIDPW